MGQSGVVDLDKAREAFQLAPSAIHARDLILAADACFDRGSPQFMEVIDETISWYSADIINRYPRIMAKLAEND